MSAGVDVGSVDCELGSVGPSENLFSRNKGEWRLLKTLFSEGGVSGAQTEGVAATVVGADADCSLNLRNIRKGLKLGKESYL